MNHKPNSDQGILHNKLMVKRLSTMLIIILSVFMMQTAWAYDGDVDYNAPYVTVDPETGTLVTIDPKAQTKTPHEATANTATAPVSAPASTEADSIPATTQGVTSQTSAASPDTSPAGEMEAATGSQLPLITGIIVVLLVAGFVFSKRKRNIVTASADTDNS